MQGAANPRYHRSAPDGGIFIDIGTQERRNQRILPWKWNHAVFLLPLRSGCRAGLCIFRNHRW